MAKKEISSTALSDLKQALKQKELGRLYFFYGEESFLMNHYLTQVKKLLLDPLTESFNFHRLTSETFDMQSFGESADDGGVYLCPGG